MPRIDDPRLTEARAIPIAEVADRLKLDDLRPQGPERVGPCPVCGGRDRFSVSTAKGVWHCRKCAAGGDGLALVAHVMGLDFRGALDWLMGAAERQVSPQESRRQEAIRAARKREQDAYAARARAHARDQARAIWSRAIPVEGTPVQAYLAGRGIDTGAVAGRLPRVLGFIPDHPCLKQLSRGRPPVELHRGPAMVARIDAPDGSLAAVHQTWLDPSAPGRRLRIREGGGDYGKMVRGSKKGNAIRLHTPQRFDTLIVGEGIETTMTAMIARPMTGAAYWAAVDLGNMSGRMRRVAGVRYSGEPDMEDGDAFVPPPWVRRLYYILDADSDPAATRAKLTAGLKRAMRRVSGLQGYIVPARAGGDLNDMLLTPEGTE